MPPCPHAPHAPMPMGHMILARQIPEGPRARARMQAAWGQRRGTDHEQLARKPGMNDSSTIGCRPRSTMVDQSRSIEDRLYCRCPVTTGPMSSSNSLPTAVRIKRVSRVVRVARTAPMPHERRHPRLGVRCVARRACKPRRGGQAEC